MSFSSFGASDDGSVPQVVAFAPLKAPSPRASSGTGPPEGQSRRNQGTLLPGARLIRRCGAIHTAASAPPSYNHQWRVGDGGTGRFEGHDVRRRRRALETHRTGRGRGRLALLRPHRLRRPWPRRACRGRHPSARPLRHLPHRRGADPDVSHTRGPGRLDRQGSAGFPDSCLRRADRGARLGDAVGALDALSRFGGSTCAQARPSDRRDAARGGRPEGQRPRHRPLSVSDWRRLWNGDDGGHGPGPYSDRRSQRGHSRLRRGRPRRAAVSCAWRNSPRAGATAMRGCC